MKILGIIKTILEIILPVLAHVKKKKAEKDLKIVMTGIELASKREKSKEKAKAVKDTIADLALQSGIYNRLHKKVKKYEDSIWKKIS